jgi:hypothetical protein
MEIPNSDFLDILQTLVAHKVEFIIVGGICATLHGVPLHTLDLDVVHSRTEENVDRLLPALEQLDAQFRDLAGRRIKPVRSHLVSPGHQLLMTRAGPFDLLGTIGEELDYANLLPDTEMIEAAPGLNIRVLTLARLIEIKEQVGRDKDKAVLPILRRTLEEKQKP